MIKRDDCKSILSITPAAPLSGALLALSLWFGAPLSQAASITYVTPTGSTAGNQPVDVTATFTVSANDVFITVQNLQTNPTSDVQTLNGIAFTLSSGQTSSSLNSFTEKGIQVSVNNTNAGGYTTTGTPTTQINSPDMWNIQSNNNAVEISSIGNSSPGAHGTLIGGPNGSNAYASANGSITGHNPFVGGVATFDLSITGLLAGATITGVQFEFGTQAGQNVMGQDPVSVPEPGTLTMASTAAVLALGAVWRARRRSSS